MALPAAIPSPLISRSIVEPLPVNQAFIRQRHGRIMEGVEEELGGRENLISTLLAAAGDVSLDYLIGMIADPRNDATKLRDLMQEGDLTLDAFYKAISTGILRGPIVSALQKVAARMPEIVGDIVTRSLVHEDDCPRCLGNGTIENPKAGRDDQPLTALCPICLGQKRVTNPPDFEKQKFVLTELAGMGKQKGPFINQNIDQRDQSQHLTARFDPSQAGHAKLLEATDKLLFARPAPRVSQAVMEAVSVPVRMDTPEESEYPAASSAATDGFLSHE